MPQYRYVCSACGSERRRICPANIAATPWVSCSGCGGELVRAPSGPTSRVVERLDNGAMSRPLERLSEAERIFKEYARVHKGEG